MTIEKCINEFDADDVIFEEGSIGRELLVVVGGRSRSMRDLDTLDDGSRPRI